MDHNADQLADPNAELDTLRGLLEASSIDLAEYKRRARAAVAEMLRRAGVRDDQAWIDFGPDGRMRVTVRG